MSRPQPPPFNWDHDASGGLGLADVGGWLAAAWGWLQWVFFFPGDAVIVFLILEFNDLAMRWEITHRWYMGWFSGAASLLIWLLVAALIWHLLRSGGEEGDETGHR